MKDFFASLRACEEALKLDTKNVKGFYLKARSRILDINSGVDELKLAVRDLKEGLRIEPTNQSIITQLQKIMKLVNINSKREKKTYLSMFDKNNSVEEYLEKTIKDDLSDDEAKKVNLKEKKRRNKLKSPLENLISPAQKKVEDKFEKKIKKFMKSKELEFSFEIKKEREKFQDIEEIRDTIDLGEEAIALYLKAGKIAEAKEIKKSLQHARYEIEMLDCVMNLDFERPRPKAQEMALEMGIDLTDEVVIREFKKIQSNRMKEVRALKEGKKINIIPKVNVETEDYNDVFRESNRAAIGNRNSEEVVEDSVDNADGSQNVVMGARQERREIPAERKMDEEDYEEGFSPVVIIVGAVVCLWISSLIYLLAFKN